MNLTRKQVADHRRYRLNKIQRALDAAGLKTEKQYRCISVEVWTHPAPSRARIGDTVAQSLSINWDDKDGYVWFEGSLRGFGADDRRTTSRDIAFVVRQFLKYREDIRLEPCLP